MKNLIKEFMQDLQRAQEHHEEYQRLQHFYKGKYAEPKAPIEFMHFDYLPQRLVRLIEWKVDLINNFFAWLWDFHRLSFLTLLMVCAIIYLVFK